MKNYAYLDKGNILHIVKEERTAKKFAKNGKYIETDVKSLNGYPYEGGNDIVVYSLDEAYINGNKVDGKKVDLKEYKSTYELYKNLM